MAKRDKGWGFFWAGLGGAAVIGLILAPSDVELWAVKVSLVVVGVCLSLTAYYFGCFRAPTTIGVPVRTVALLAIIWGGVAILAYWAWPHPRPPDIGILGYEVILFKRNMNPFANIFFQNTGGPGKIVVYSAAAIAVANADERGVKSELEKTRKKLVSEGGGLVFTVKPQEKRWFTVMGPELNAKQRELLQAGTYAFFFSGTIISEDKTPIEDFCSFVIGNRPNVILQCPD